MDIVENLDVLSKKDNSFVKYGLQFNIDGSIQGPKRPPLHAETPSISIEGGNLDLSPHKSFLERFMKSERFSITDEGQELMDIVGKLFTSVTNHNINDYMNFIFMEGKDWDTFKPKLKANHEEGKNYDAINLGGLVVVGAESDNRILPLLLHEAGHSLYPHDENHFKGELQAYYFQRVATEILHNQLTQMGLHYSYPNYDDADMFPSTSHKDAYQSAIALYAYQSLPSWFQEKLDPNDIQTMQELLAVVKQESQNKNSPSTLQH